MRVMSTAMAATLAGVSTVALLSDLPAGAQQEPTTSVQTEVPPVSEPRSGSSLWERFARQHYLGGDNLGREYYRGSHLKNERAPGSWVVSTEHRVSDEEATKIRQALRELAPPEGAPILPDHYQAWSGDSGEKWLLATFCTEVDRPEKGMIDVYFGDQLRRIAAYADRLDAAVWLRGEEVIVIRSNVHLGASREMDVCPIWEPFDVVDIDQDGDPEVVLVTHSYESQSLQILSLRGSAASLLWEGLGSGL